MAKDEDHQGKGLRPDEQRYRKILRMSGDVVWELDADNRCIYFSEDFEENPCWKASDFVGKRPNDLEWQVPGDDSWRELVVKLDARQFIDNHEFSVQIPTLGRRVYRFTGEPLFDDDGQFTGYLGLSRNITADAEKIAKAQRRLEDIATSTSDWFWEMDADLRFTYISDRVSEVFGVPINQFIGRRPDELAHDIVDKDVMAAHGAELKARRPFREFVYCSVRHDGTTYWTSTSGVPVFSESGEFAGYRGAARDITANIEAQQRADDAQALFLDAINNSPVGIMLWDADEGFVAGNAEHLEWLPKSLVGELVPGRKFEDFIHLMAHSGFMVDAVGREEDWIVERLERHRDIKADSFIQQRASGRWVRVTNNRTVDGGVFSTYVDITEIKQSEEALRAAEAQLIDAIETIDHGLALYDKDDGFVLCNSLYRNSFPIGFSLLKRGMKFEKIIREAAKQNLYDDEVDFVERRLAQHRNPGTTIEIDLAKGRLHDLSVADGSTLLLTERRTQAGGMVSIWTDITKQKRREEALAVSQRRFHLAFDSSPALVAISTMVDGTFIDANAQWLKTLGYSKDEVIGHSALDLDIWANADDRHNLIASLERDGSAYDLETVLRRKDGSTVDLLASCEVLEFEGKKQVMFVCTNYSERKLMETELRRAKNEAEYASRTKSEFLANMSHELRTPLNAIIGFAEFIEHQMYGPVGDARYLDYLNDIKDSGLHLLDLINDILDVSRIEAGKMELRENVFDINALIDGSLRMVTDRAELAGVVLGVNVDRDLPHLRGDETRVKQILVNLLSNAVKFTPRAGRITVSSSLGPTGGIEVAVADTGIGIAEENIETVLQVFGQVDSKRGRIYDGVGLGLPLTKSLIELHGGSLEIESAVGEGAIFTVAFPSTRSVAVAHFEN